VAGFPTDGGEPVTVVDDLIRQLAQLDVLARDLSTASYERGFADASSTVREEHEMTVLVELASLRAYLEAYSALQRALRTSLSPDEANIAVPTHNPKEHDRA
jgi:hypothetical protein